MIAHFRSIQGGMLGDGYDIFEILERRRAKQREAKRKAGESLGGYG